MSVTRSASCFWSALVLPCLVSAIAAQSSGTTSSTTLSGYGWNSSSTIISLSSTSSSLSGPTRSLSSAQSSDSAHSAVPPTLTGPTVYVTELLRPAETGNGSYLSGTSTPSSSISTLSNPTALPDSAQSSDLTTSPGSPPSLGSDQSRVAVEVSYIGSGHNPYLSLSSFVSATISLLQNVTSGSVAPATTAFPSSEVPRGKSAPCGAVGVISYSDGSCAYPNCAAFGMVDPSGDGRCQYPVHNPEECLANGGTGFGCPTLAPPTSTVNLTGTALASYESSLSYRRSPQCVSCCGLCYLTFPSVDIFYFPVAGTNTNCHNGGASATATAQSASLPSKGIQRRVHSVFNNGSAITAVGDDGFIYTSPSIYVAFHNVYATDDCGLLGSYHTSLTLAFAPGELSTLVDPSGFGPGFGGGHPVMLDVADLQCPSSAALIGAGYDQSEHYKPILAAPSKLLNLDPSWHDCQVDRYQGVDPPRALTPAVALDPATSTKDPDMKPTPASPSSIPPALPKETDHAMTANAPSPLSQPSSINGDPSKAAFEPPQPFPVQPTQPIAAADPGQPTASAAPKPLSSDPHPGAVDPADPSAPDPCDWRYKERTLFQHKHHLTDFSERIICDSKYNGQDCDTLETPIEVVVDVETDTSAAFKHMNDQPGRWLTTEATHSLFEQEVLLFCMAEKFMMDDLKELCYRKVLMFPQGPKELAVLADHIPAKVYRRENSDFYNINFKMQKLLSRCVQYHQRFFDEWRSRHRCDKSSPLVHEYAGYMELLERQMTPHGATLFHAMAEARDSVEERTSLMYGWSTCAEERIGVLQSEYTEAAAKLDWLNHANQTDAEAEDKLPNTLKSDNLFKGFEFCESKHGDTISRITVDKPVKGMVYGLNARCEQWGFYPRKMLRFLETNSWRDCGCDDCQPPSFRYEGRRIYMHDPNDEGRPYRPGNRQKHIEKARKARD